MLLCSIMSGLTDKGYPYGLKGNDILLEARILAVIDAYSAMRNKRPYRQPMSIEEAFVEMKRFSGIQFDSNVLITLFDVVGES